MLSDSKVGLWRRRKEGLLLCLRFHGYLLNGGGGLQSAAACRDLVCQVTPLLLQGADPLLDGSLAELTLFGQQILTSSQKPLVLRVLGLELRLQNLTHMKRISTQSILLFAVAAHRLLLLMLMKAHLVFVLGQLDVADVSAQTSGLQPQPALVQPGLHRLTVMEELQQPELSLQLFPPDRADDRLTSQSLFIKPRWVNESTIAKQPPQVFHPEPRL